jgi:undecaprenyl-diphosphatase
MNSEIFYFFNNFALQNEWVDTFIIFLAIWLIWWLIFGVIVLFFLKKIKLKSITKIFTITLIAWGLSKVIKIFCFSPRPFIELTDVKTLLTHGLNDSFPSGHATFSFALATAIYFYTNHKIGLLFILGATLIGLSRIIVGIHWPFDILAGAVLGSGVSLIYFLKNK